MLIHFDFWDFTKSAWSLATGSFTVFLLALFRDPIDTSTVILTLGLTLGVLALWGLFCIKFFLQSRNLAQFEEEPTENFPPHVQDGLPQQQMAFPYLQTERTPSYEPMSFRLRPLKSVTTNLETRLASEP